MVSFPQIGIITGLLALAFIVWIVWTMLKINRHGRRIAAQEDAKRLSKQIVMEKLINLGLKNPFSVKRGEETDLEIEWDIVKAKWKEVLGEAWDDKVYRAWLTFYEDDNLVKYCEMIYEKTGLKAGPRLFSNSFSFEGAEIFRREPGYKYAVTEEGKIGEVYDYHFDPKDVREVVRQIVNEHGWDFMLVIRKPAKEGGSG